MEPLKISEYPDSILRKKCAVIERVTDSEAAILKEMLFTLRHFAGIGLAAPQIGISKSLIVADIGEGAVMLANPVILRAKGSGKMDEGCLSLPGVSVNIDRPDEILVGGLNEKGNPVEIEAHGLLARVLQHEIDHLKGKLILDYVGLLEKMIMFKTKFKKAKGKYANL